MVVYEAFGCVSVVRAWLVYCRGAPDMQFSNPAGTGFTGIGQKFRPVFRPDMPELGINWDNLGIIWDNFLFSKWRPYVFSTV